MPSLKAFFGSSVGFKILNAASGLGLSIFIVVHLIGNLTLLTGNAEAFNHYAHFLSNTGFLLYLSEGGLVLFFLFHIITSTTVWWSKQMARPEKYVKSASAGSPSKKTISSVTMIYTGIILLTFTIIHLKTLKYGPGIAEGYSMEIGGVIMRDLYRLAVEVFQSPIYTVWYVVSMTLLGFHLRHGIWSAFQSLGVNHPRYTPIINGLGYLFAVIMGIGFVALPVVLFLRGGSS